MDILLAVVGIIIALVGTVAAVFQVLLQLQERKRVEQEKRNYLPVSKEHGMLVDRVHSKLIRGENKQALEAIQKTRSDEWGYSGSDGLAEATRFFYEAEARTNLNEKAAIGLLRQCIQLAEDASPSDEYRIQYKEWIIGRAHHDIGYTYKTFRNYGDAVEEYLAALPHLYRSTNQNSYAHTLKNLAYIYSLQGKLAAAELICQDALGIFETLGDLSGKALSQNTLGLIYGSSKQYDVGQIFCRRALETYESLADKDPRGIGLACIGLGRILRHMGATGHNTEDQAISLFEEAQRLLEHSLKIFESPESEPIRRVEALGELGCTYRDWAKLHRQFDNRKEKAGALERRGLEYLQKSLDRTTELDLIVEKIDTLEDLAELEFNRGKVENALGFLDQVDKNVPKEYCITKTRGVPRISEAISEFWATLGKSHLLHGHIAFDKEYRVEASKHYVLSSAYFQLYSDSTPLIDFAMPSIYTRLRRLA